MANKSSKNLNGDPTPELLRDLLIVELAKANVQQHDIRKIVGCDIHRVSKIAKVLKKAKNNSAD
jgi:hypothetical protein